MKKRFKRNTDAEKKNQSKVRIFFFAGAQFPLFPHTNHLSLLPRKSCARNKWFPVKANRWRISRDRRLLTHARVEKDNPAAPRPMAPNGWR